MVCWFVSSLVSCPPTLSRKFIMHLYIQGIYTILDQHRNDEIAGSMKQYMRNQFDFFGIRAEERRGVSK